MAKLGHVQVPSPEDVSTFPDSVRNVLLRTDINEALAGTLTFTENFAAEIRDIEFRTPLAPFGWIAPTFNTDWSNYSATYDTAGYRIDQFGRVDLKGTVKHATALGDIFTLPVGYRPALHKYFAAYSYGILGGCWVKSTGEVRADVGDYRSFSLEGMSFDAVTPALPLAFSGDGWPIGVGHTLGERVTGVVPLSCQPKDRNGRACAPTIDWDTGKSGTIFIRAIYGLTPGMLYKMKLLLVTR